MTGYQKSSSWLPIINLDILKSVKLQVISTQTHTQTNNGQHPEEHNIWYIRYIFYKKIATKCIIQSQLCPDSVASYHTRSGYDGRGYPTNSKHRRNEWNNEAEMTVYTARGDVKKNG